MAVRNKDFWKEKNLSELTRPEWESLCDGCAKCCLHRLEDEDTHKIWFTNVHCRLLDTENCLCTDYENRSVRVPDCVTLTPAKLEDPYWLPPTCAYRLLAEGKDLPDWHPLITGDSESVHIAGHGIGGRSICEDDADDLEQHIITNFD